MKILSTNRLILQPIQAGDLEFIHHLLTNIEVMEFVFSGPLSSLEAREGFIQKNFTTESESLGFNVLYWGSKIIGFAGTSSCQCLKADDVEFGFAIDKEYWGLGCATEIGKRMISYCFNSLNSDRALAMAHPNNLGSCRVLEEKLGMTFIKTISLKDREFRRLYQSTKGKIYG